MKLQFVLSLLLISAICTGQNNLSKIDALNSEADVQQFIRSFKMNMDSFRLIDLSTYRAWHDTSDFCGRTARALNINNNYYKEDLDNNGLTDLLAIGDNYSFEIPVIMDFGNDSLKLIPLTRRSFQNCIFPVIQKKGKGTIVAYYHQPEDVWPPKNKLKDIEKKELIFKYGDFIEVKKGKRAYQIENIEFKTSPCFGSCPVMSISIDQFGNATFSGDMTKRVSRQLKSPTDIYTTRIDRTSLEEIIGLLNYIDFPKLKDKYEVGWTDDQTSWLTVTYDNGGTKSIEDYGLIGTYGLDRLYKIFFDLRQTQIWVKTSK